MVWYVPPLSPIQNAIEKGVIDHRGPIPNVEDLRIPVRYLANMLTAGMSILCDLLESQTYLRKRLTPLFYTYRQPCHSKCN
jgi:nitrate reductase beta subunit